MLYNDERRIGLYRLIVLALFISFGASAQTGTISLKDALAAADKNYPTVKAKMNFIKAAEQNIKEARREYIPSLNMIEQVTYSTSNSLPGSYFNYGVSVSGSVNPQQLNNPNFGQVSALQAQWPVFTFGQQVAKVNIAKSQEQLAETDLANEKFQLSIRTAQAYFDLIALINLRKSEEVNLHRAQSIRNIIHASTVNGLKPGADSSIANAEVSKAKMALIDAQNNEQMQRNYLAELIGVPNGNSINPDTSFLQKLPPQSIQNGNTDNNPLLLYYKQREALSYANEVFVRRSYLPKISLLGEAWGRGSGISPDAGNAVNPSFGDGTNLSRFNYAIGIGAVFNIADYPRMSAQANALKFQTMGLQEQTNEQKLELQTQLNNADADYTSSYNKAVESPVLVSAATTAYKQMTAMYNSGLINLTDLAQALCNLNYAETQNTISYDNVWKALLFKAIPTGDMNVLLKQL